MRNPEDVWVVLVSVATDMNQVVVKIHPPVVCYPQMRAGRRHHEMNGIDPVIVATWKAPPTLSPILPITKCQTGTQSSNSAPTKRRP